MSREQYEAYQTRLLGLAGYEPGQIEELLGIAYPKSTEETVHELGTRGLDAPPWRIEQFVRANADRLRVVGGSRLWFKHQVDALARQLEGAGCLTTEARLMKDKGTTLAHVLGCALEEAERMTAAGSVQ